jgi:hypothetical protein
MFRSYGQDANNKVQESCKILAKVISKAKKAYYGNALLKLKPHDLIIKRENGS